MVSCLIMVTNSPEIHFHYKGNFVKQDFLPEEIRTQRIWHAQDNPSEQKLKERMVSLWGDRFKE